MVFVIYGTAIVNDIKESTSEIVFSYSVFGDCIIISDKRVKFSRCRFEGKVLVKAPEPPELEYWS